MFLQFLLLILIYYVGAVITLTLFRCGEAFGHYEDIEQNFAVVFWPISLLVWAVILFTRHGVGKLSNVLVERFCPKNDRRDW